jgi:hypothetical protein
VLERLPYSGGVLMARAISAGRVHLPAARIAPSVATPALTCSPAPCVLPNVDAAEGGTNPVNEDPIAVNPNNASQWITGGNDYNCPSLQGFFATSDNGSTFTRTCMATLAGKVGAGDPALGYDLSGNVYIAGIDANGSFTTSQIAISKSTDGGLTFGAPHVAVSSLSGGFADKEWMEIDTNSSSPFAGSIYISLTDFASNNNSQITVSHSTDGGATFSTVKVGAVGVFPNVNQFSDLAVAKDGTVYVSYINCTANGAAGDCGGTSTKLQVAKSTDGGVTWTTPVTAATVTLAPDACFCAFYGSLPNTSERMSDIPVIAVDNSSGASSGKLYMAFYHWTGTFMSVRVITSTDGGATWSSQSSVATNTHDQFLPWINVSSTGFVAVTFLDRRNDAANVNYQAFAALSKNGTTWVNKKIATAVSNPFNDGFGGGFMGDYTGNAWNGKSILASWMDTRSGVSQDEVGGITLP